MAPSGTLRTLHSFDGTDGSHPYAALVQATDGNLYGTTLGGGVGTDPQGTVFKITPSGTLTTLYTFCPAGPINGNTCTDGVSPYAALVQDTNGKFYGTTPGGGSIAAFGGEKGRRQTAQFPVDGGGQARESLLVAAAPVLEAWRDVTLRGAFILAGGHGLKLCSTVLNGMREDLRPSWRVCPPLCAFRLTATLE
jgi:uncharacterized repeat protein (TIGR03803 family)